jgi:hypothetical protein
MWTTQKFTENYRLPHRLSSLQRSFSYSEKSTNEQRFARIHYHIELPGTDWAETLGDRWLRRWSRRSLWETTGLTVENGERLVSCDESNRRPGKSTSFRRQKVPSIDLENFFMHKYCDRGRWPSVLCSILININPGNFWGSLDSATVILEFFVFRAEDRANVSCEPPGPILPKWKIAWGKNEKMEPKVLIYAVPDKNSNNGFQWNKGDSEALGLEVKNTVKDGCHGSNLRFCLTFNGPFRMYRVLYVS